MINLLLFWEFFKTGLFAIGGGPVTIPFLMNISERTGWFTLNELADMLAISESTPGPMGINMATYVGYKVSGVFGSAIATFGLVLPSLIIIMIIAALLEKFAEKPFVKFTFSKLRAMVIGLITFALYKLFSIVFLVGLTSFDYIGLLFLIVCVAVNLKYKKIHPLFFILAGALFGIILE